MIGWPLKSFKLVAINGPLFDPLGLQELPGKVKTSVSAGLASEAAICINSRIDGLSVAVKKLVAALAVTTPSWPSKVTKAFVTFDGQDGVVTASAATSFFTATESPSILEFMQIAASDANPADTEVLTFPGSSCSPSGSNNGPFIATSLNDLSGQPITDGHQ